MSPILFIIILSLISSSQPSDRMRETKIILDNLFATYDPRIRPSTSNFSGEPVEITFNLLILHFDDASMFDKDFKIHIFLRQEWYDDRLAYEDKGKVKHITLFDVSRIWTSSVHFHDNQHGKLHSITKPNAYVRIFPSGKVLYSASITVTISCDMQLRRFPFDASPCYLRISSFAYSVDEIIFKWKQPGDGRAIQIVSSSVKNTFPVNRIGAFYCPETSQFSCLGLKMVYQRDTQYYLLHTFLPSSLLVAGSWGLGFLIDRNAVSARGLVVFSALLGLTFIFAEVPKLDYFKAIDIWIGGCFVFLLSELAVFAVVGSPETDSVSSTNTSRVEGGDVTVLVEMSTLSSLGDRTPQVEARDRHQASVYRQILHKLPSDPGHINRISCCALPILYILFSAVYFLHYCYYDEDDEEF